MRRLPATPLTLREQVDTLETRLAKIQERAMDGSIPRQRLEAYAVRLSIDEPDARRLAKADAEKVEGEVVMTLMTANDDLRLVLSSAEAQEIGGQLLRAASQ